MGLFGKVGKVGKDGRKEALGQSSVEPREVMEQRYKSAISTWASGHEPDDEIQKRLSEQFPDGAIVEQLMAGVRLYRGISDVPGRKARIEELVKTIGVQQA